MRARQKKDLAPAVVKWPADAVPTTSWWARANGSFYRQAQEERHRLRWSRIGASWGFGVGIDSVRERDV